MNESTNCFCDLYKDCTKNPQRKVSVGYDMVNKQEVCVDGSEFIERANLICPGTSVFIAKAALSAENVIIEGAQVTFPREAVSFQCEYFIAANPGM